MTSRVMCLGTARALLVAIALLAACSTLRRRNGRPAPSDSQREMIAALHATGPHASLGADAKLFDRFVGTWDADYTFYARDGTVSRQRGEVRFGWVLDGRAMQDVWITYTRDGGRELGTTLRIHDARSATWQIVWIYLPRGIVALLSGGAVGDRIVLRGSGEDGSLVRWSFNDIEPTSFVWRGERSYDQGTTWRLTGEYRMTRRSVPPR